MLAVYHFNIEQGFEPVLDAISDMNPLDKDWLVSKHHLEDVADELTLSVLLSEIAPPTFALPHQYLYDTFSTHVSDSDECSTLDKVIIVDTGSDTLEEASQRFTIGYEDNPVANWSWCATLSELKIFNKSVTLDD